MNNDVEKLEKCLRKCAGASRNIDEDFIQRTIEYVAINDFNDLARLFTIYIDADNQFHQTEKCPCEVKNIGLHFATAIGSQQFPGGWTALHHAVNTRQKCKRGAVSSIIERDPSLLCKVNRKNETPFMIAALRNPEIFKFMLDLQGTFGDQVKEAINFVNTDGESALTYSFKFKRPLNSDIEHDITYFILASNTFTVDIPTVIKAIAADNCPDGIILELAKRLHREGNQSPPVTNDNLVEILRPLLQRQKMDSAQFISILRSLNITADATYLKTNDSDDFNILHELAKIVTESSSKELFATLYTNYFKESHTKIHSNPDDQKNIAHFACIEGNLTLLDFLQEMGELVEMLECYDSDNKRPTFYFKTPLKLLKHFKSDNACTALWKNLCKDNGYNIVHRVLTRSYADQFEDILQLDVSWLQECDRYNP